MVISKIKLNNTTYDIKDASVISESKTAASGGTDLSLVTTNEKYTWNNKGVGTITKVGNTTSGTVAVSSSNNTASFGNTVTVGSVGGVDLKFTMPANSEEMTSVEAITGVGNVAKTISPSTLDDARRGKELKVSGSSATMTFTPGVHLVFGTMTSLTFNSGTVAVLADSDTVQTNAYSFEFDSGSTATTLSLPSSIIFSDELSIEANTHYEVNIKYNPKTNKYYGLIASWPNE